VQIHLKFIEYRIFNFLIWFYCSISWIFLSSKSIVFHSVFFEILIRIRYIFSSVVFCSSSSYVIIVFISNLNFMITSIISHSDLLTSSNIIRIFIHWPIILIYIFKQFYHLLFYSKHKFPHIHWFDFIENLLSSSALILNIFFSIKFDY
jgi:hypothetical protein